MSSANPWRLVMHVPVHEKLSRIKNEVEDLHPLLNVLLANLPGVSHVDYTHGAFEMGADFVLTRQNVLLETPEYVGVIAKVGKIHQDFDDIKRQIDECSVERPYLSGKQKIRIDEIYVITTGTITQGAQDKIHEFFRQRKITFVNGLELAKLIDKHAPYYWSQIGLAVGRYLTELRARNEEIDRSMSLLPVANKNLYVEQDIYERTELSFGSRNRKPHAAPRKLRIEDIVRDNRVSLVEGTMGSGKSKLIRRIVEMYSNPAVFNETKYLPVFITFKELIEEFDGDIDKLVSARLGDAGEGLPPDVTYLILVDAVDEKNMQSDEQLQSLGRLISVVTRRSNMKLLITSRPLESLDDDNEIHRNIGRFELRPLSLEKTVEFIKALCRKSDISSRIIEDLKKSQLFKELPRSPIAAILLARLIDENSHDLPSNMTELYAQYIEHTLGRWDVLKGLQLQKEYQALDQIMCRIAKFIMDNDIPSISVGDARAITHEYLDQRNLEIDPDALFEKMLNRCDLITPSTGLNKMVFKHRTFVEYFYARSLGHDSTFVLKNNRAFTRYWSNTCFFYLGLKKDCPNELRALIDLAPANEAEAWAKVVNMASYFMAAYATPKEVIEHGVTRVIIEAATLYRDIVTGRIESSAVVFPRVVVLMVMQYLIHYGYSYSLLKSALEQAALHVKEEVQDSDVRICALYFLNSAYIQIDEKESFEFLLKDEDNIPLDIALAMKMENQDNKKKCLVVKKQEKRLARLLKQDPGAKKLIDEIVDTPLQRLIDRKKKLAAKPTGKRLPEPQR
jgi:hypothetical protein